MAIPFDGLDRWSPMNQVTCPSPLSNDKVEEAAIALLEAESVDATVGMLLETCLVHSQGDRGAVLLEAPGLMGPAIARPSGLDQIDLLSRVRQTSIGGTSSTLVNARSA